MKEIIEAYGHLIKYQSDITFAKRALTVESVRKMCAKQKVETAHIWLCIVLIAHLCVCAVTSLRSLA